MAAGKLIPWVLDGADSQQQPIHSNDSVDTYLSEDHLKRSTFIIGPKGYGKTLLLKERNQIIRNSNWEKTIVPSDSFREAVNPNTWGSRNDRDLIADAIYWSELWRHALTIVAYGMENLPLPATMGSIFGESIPKTLMDVLGGWFTANLHKRLRQLRAELDLESGMMLRSLQRDYVFFLDDADETSNSSSTHQQKIWRAAQRGLLLAVFELNKRTRRIRVNATLRPQAMHVSHKPGERGDLNLQLEQLLHHLDYSSEDLTSIFEIHCRYTPSRFLLGDFENPIYRFLGRKTVTWKAQEEDAFRYIKRHTLEKPRELIYIGAKLCASHSRSEDEFRRVINECGGVIFQTYIEEMFRGKHAESVRTGFNFVKSNALHGNELDIIDDIVEKETKFKSWSAHMVESGLIGRVVRDKENGFRIEFSRAGTHVHTDDEAKRPESKIYLLHPCCYEELRRSSPGFQVAVHGIENRAAFNPDFRRSCDIRVVRDRHKIRIETATASIELDEYETGTIYLVCALELLGTDIATGSSVVKKEDLIQSIRDYCEAAGRHWTQEIALKSDARSGAHGSFSSNNSLNKANAKLAQLGLRFSVNGDRLVLCDSDSKPLRSDVDAIFVRLMCTLGQPRSSKPRDEPWPGLL